MSQLDLKSVKPKLQVGLAQFHKYAVIIFLALVVILYGTIMYKIHTLSNEQPSQDAVTSQVKGAKIPHINPQVVQQLQSLQDNSVSVQSLFDQARQNPFQE